LGLRERKRARTAEQIEEAALELFRAKGYNATTVEDIAESVQISRATVFRYFPAKEDILFARDESDREHLAEVATGHRTADSFEAAVRGSVADFARHLVADDDRLWLRWSIVAEDPRLLGRCLVAVAGWADTLARAIVAEPTFPQRVVVSAAMCGLYEAIRLGRVAEDDLVARVDEALDALGIGVGDGSGPP
jgi:AcrR family transcriptional regulator